MESSIGREHFELETAYLKINIIKNKKNQRLFEAKYIDFIPVYFFLISLCHQPKTFCQPKLKILSWKPNYFLRTTFPGSTTISRCGSNTAYLQEMHEKILKKYVCFP
jgi:hypothetical protein